MDGWLEERRTLHLSPSSSVIFSSVVAEPDQDNRNATLLSSDTSIMLIALVISTSTSSILSFVATTGWREDPLSLKRQRTNKASPLLLLPSFILQIRTPSSTSSSTSSVLLLLATIMMAANMMSSLYLLIILMLFCRRRRGRGSKGPTDSFLSEEWEEEKTCRAVLLY